MTPRYRLLIALVTVLALAIAVACGGGDGGSRSSRPGNLTDPRDVPTATPWSSPPEVVIIDPDNIQPLPPVGVPGEGGQGGEAEATPTAGECGETYIVVAGDTPSGIAEKCGITTQELLEANPGLDPTGLHVGDEIRIPGGGQ